jgi:hypothetical protein
MKRAYVAKLGTIVMIAGLCAASVGCNRLLWSTNAVSAAVSWLLGSAASGNVTTQCYQNGVLIDCSELPADLAN